MHFGKGNLERFKKRGNITNATHTHTLNELTIGEGNARAYLPARRCAHSLWRKIDFEAWAIRKVTKQRRRTTSDTPHH